MNSWSAKRQRFPRNGIGFFGFHTHVAVQSVGTGSCTIFFCCDVSQLPIWYVSKHIARYTRCMLRKEPPDFVLKHSAPERSLKSLQTMSVSFLGCLVVKRVSGVLDCAARHPYQTSHLHTKEARSFAEDPWTTTCEEGSCEWEMIVFQ